MKASWWIMALALGCGPRPPLVAEPLAQAVSAGRLAGFRQIYVDPATVGDLLRPVGQSPHRGPDHDGDPGRGTLELINPRSVPCEVAVQGLVLGRVPGGGAAAVQDLAVGRYDVEWIGPDGERSAASAVVGPS